MNKLPIILLAFAVTANLQVDKVSTMSGVCLTAGVISSENPDTETKKYKRKDCPVCKGKGWYISGDGIAKVDCGYCEPEDGESQEDSEEECCKTELIIE
jgi:hypothetical protein